MKSDDDDVLDFHRKLSLSREPLRQQMLALRQKLSVIANMKAPDGFHYEMMEVLSRVKKLSFDGWEDWPHGFANTFADRTDSIFQLKTWLIAMLDPKEASSRGASSYGLKSLAEKQRGIYTSNGDMILAAILAGYDYGGWNGLNCDIYVTEESMKETIKTLKHIGLPKETFLNLKEFLDSGSKEIIRAHTWLDVQPAHLRKKG